MAITYAGELGLPGLCRLHAGYDPEAVDGCLTQRYRDARSTLTNDEREKIVEIQISEKQFHVRGRGKHGGVLGFTPAHGRHHVGRLQYLCEFLYGRGQVRSGTAPCLRGWNYACHPLLAQAWHMCNILELGGGRFLVKGHGAERGEQLPGGRLTTQTYLPWSIIESPER